ncbi:hypothetical protein, partial [Dyella mobilis]|uniref:hypothetical protein n=1 Tax=Dyella mobilis TaxID=1849582 RepID=UPI0024E10970
RSNKTLEAILAERVVCVNPEIKTEVYEYFIKWKNLPDSEASWEHQDDPILQDWKKKMKVEWKKKVKSGL